MLKLITESFKHSLMITAFVFVMMVLVDYINVLTRGKMNKAVRGGLFRQYVFASFLGTTPGCLGAFMNVSFYVHGLLSFGAMVGGMIATSGDEAFVMLTLFQDKALLLFVILFLMGIVLAWIADKMALILKIKPCQECQLSVLHLEEFATVHFLEAAFPIGFVVVFPQSCLKCEMRRSNCEKAVLV
jgi:hypothetical protein